MEDSQADLSFTGSISPTKTVGGNNANSPTALAMKNAASGKSAFGGGGGGEGKAQQQMFGDTQKHETPKFPTPHLVSKCFYFSLGGCIVVVIF